MKLMRCIGTASLLLALSAESFGAAGAEEIDFNRQVRPILSNRCYECHGPDEGERKAGLRLDEREGAVARVDGIQAIVPGKPSDSELMRRISRRDEDVMPPPGHGKPLEPAQVEILHKWILAGAPYARHWAFEPVARPELPEPPSPEARRRIRNGVDAFIEDRLDQAGIKPSPEADRHVLVRRAHLDLLGLPPSLEELDSFLRDVEPGAYERMLDRALGNQHFGERWGRHWLDQARYADSHGYTNDNARSIWPYRDWVIEAFNRDLPFDRFTVEQLAGDMLPEATLRQQVATGFHRNTLINSEGGTKADQFRDEQVKDRVDTTGLVWMGLTVGCAQCHTHKFDPISQKEYYGLYAFFNSTQDNNSVAPTVQVASLEQEAEIAELVKRQASLAKRLKDFPNRAKRQRAWERTLSGGAGEPGVEKIKEIEWTVLELSGRTESGVVLTALPGKSLLASGKPGKKDEYLATARSPLTKIRSVKLEALTDPSLPKSGPGRAGNGNFVLSEFWFRTGDGRELRFNKAGADHSQPGYAISAAIDGKSDPKGWAINNAPEGSMNRNRTAWFVLAETLEVEENHALVFKMHFHHQSAAYALGRFRLSVSAEEWVEKTDLDQIVSLLSLKEVSDEQQRKIDNAFIRSAPDLRGIDAELRQTTKRLDAVRRAQGMTMVLRELPKPRPTHLQVRGDFLRTADAVEPHVPAALSPFGDWDRSRLGLARWLTSPEHPLTARVRVNRIWMRLFGRGLVETENDFGNQGTPPTHPKLLDWLATEFVARGWSTKEFLKLVMSSATYRRSSQARPDLAVSDPWNLLLARQARLRVEAEIVRDLALAVSGKLSSKIGGPSVYPPQEAGVYAFTQRRKSWPTSSGENRYRRGLYTFFYRSAPYPMLSTFDAPKFNRVCTSRNRSNTPLQSLTMANSEAMHELAENLGVRMSEASGDGIEYGFRLCLARPPTSKEKDRLMSYLEASRQRFSDEATAWTAVARVLINLDEFLTRE